MDMEQIKSLLGMLNEHDVSEFQYKDGDISLRLRLGPPPMVAAVAPTMVAAAPGVAPAALVAVAGAPAAPAATTADGVIVASPMVGTLYASPNPESDPFVAVGDRVAKGQTLCIIEAMKLMNEIEADVAGVVTERLVDNAQPVEFGQPIFRIRPD